MAIVVSSDGKFKPFLYDYEVPKKVLDWLDKSDKTDGWVQYKGQYMHLSDFQRLSGPGMGRDWTGAQADGFSSGTVVKITDDGEDYKIGFYRQVDDDYKPKRGEKVYRDR